MKKLICLIIPLCFLLSGCEFFAEQINDSVTFYYLRSTYQQDMETVIGSEERDAAGHRDDLSYLLALYLIGPSGDDLVCPIPKGIQISSVKQENNTVELRLSDTEKAMTDAQFTLACACLTMTCFDLTDAEEVTIQSGSRTITMTRENLSLTDTTTAVTEETQ